MHKTPKVKVSSHGKCNSAAARADFEVWTALLQNTNSITFVLSVNHSEGLQPMRRGERESVVCGEKEERKRRKRLPLKWFSKQYLKKKKKKLGKKTKHNQQVFLLNGVN